jgi:hypothetical protein
LTPVCWWTSADALVTYKDFGWTTYIALFFMAAFLIMTQTFKFRAMKFYTPAALQPYNFV